jgi:hypothetical protein
MLYSILIYDSEAQVTSWTQREDDALTAQHVNLQKGLAERGKLGPVIRLMPTTAAVTLRTGGRSVILDGPFAETKEQLLGLYVVDCATLEEAIETARLIPNKTGAFVLEIRPVSWFNPGIGLQPVT